MAEQKIQIAKFYETKSILRSWNFEVDFSSMTSDYHGSVISGYISKFHVVDINIPSWNFKQNVVRYGSVPKSYTTLDSDNSYSFKITLEDDDRANITQLVYYLQTTIMDEYGVYKSLKSQLLGDCIVRMYNQSQQTVIVWKMENCRFIGSEDWTLNYANGDPFKVILNFSCDNMSYEQPDDLVSKTTEEKINEISNLGIDNRYDYPNEHLNARHDIIPEALRKKKVDRGTYFNF